MMKHMFNTPLGRFSPLRMPPRVPWFPREARGRAPRPHTPTGAWERRLHRTAGDGALHYFEDEVR